MKAFAQLVLAVIVLLTGACATTREQTRTFLLRHSQAADVVRVLTPCLPCPSAVHAAPDGRSVVVTASASGMRDAEMIVEAIDQPTPLVEVQCRPFMNKQETQELLLQLTELVKTTNIAEQAESTVPVEAAPSTSSTVR